jgi:hypothetical protein
MLIWEQAGTLNNWSLFRAFPAEIPKAGGYDGYTITSVPGT